MSSASENVASSSAAQHSPLETQRRRRASQERRRSLVRRPSSSSKRTTARQASEDRQEYRYAVAEDSISEWLKCPICLSPFVDPVVAPRCEHAYCQECIGQHLATLEAQRISDEDGADNADDRHPASRSSSSSRSGGESAALKDMYGHCPTCRTTFTAAQLRPAATLIRNMVDSLLVKCWHEARGCMHICERSHVDTHARRDCEYAYVGEYESEEEVLRAKELPDKDPAVAISRNAGRGQCECGKRVLRKDWHSHITTPEQCSVLRVECPFAQGPQGCRTWVKAGELEQHMSECPARPTHCAHCHMQMPSGQLDEHHENDCSEYQLACPFAEYGCSWTGRRADLGSVEDDGAKQSTSGSPVHLSECKLAPLRLYIEAQASLIDDLQRQNDDLHVKLHAMESQQVAQGRLIQQCAHALGEFIQQQPVRQAQGEWRDEQVIRRSTSDIVVPAASSQQRPTSTPSPAPAQRRRPSSSSWAPNDEDRRDAFPLASASAPARANESVDRFFAENDADGRQTTVASSATEEAHDGVTVSDSLRQVYDAQNMMRDQYVKMERRMDDAHAVSMNASFEAGRAHDELNSVRHAMHSVRLQMHSLLMQQQMERNMSPSHPSLSRSSSSIPLLGRQSQPPQSDQQDPLSPAMASTPALRRGDFNQGIFPPSAAQLGLRRFWTGFEQTKL